LIVVWLFTRARLGSHAAERRAQQLVALSFFVLAAYVGVESRWVSCPPGNGWAYEVKCYRGPVT
jgi:hypothetical protein